MATNRDCRIDYIEFTTHDIEATKVFYTQIFGWIFVEYGPAYASFRDGQMSGGFRQAELPATSGPLVVIFADDLAATEQRVKDAGGSITKETFSFPGGSRFHFRDPGGNELAVWHED